MKKLFFVTAVMVSLVSQANPMMSIAQQACSVALANKDVVVGLFNTYAPDAAKDFVEQHSQFLVGKKIPPALAARQAAFAAALDSAEKIINLTMLQSSVSQEDLSDSDEELDFVTDLNFNEDLESLNQLFQAHVAYLKACSPLLGKQGFIDFEKDECLKIAQSNKASALAKLANARNTGQVKPVVQLAFELANKLADSLV